LAIDASRFGNEARFINDFRGVLSRPNVEFREYQDTKTQQVRMGVFVLSVPIDKGQELCVTYGKSFWRERGVLESGK
jgi:SET domain-containing protein